MIDRRHQIHLVDDPGGGIGHLEAAARTRDVPVGGVDVAVVDARHILALGRCAAGRGLQGGDVGIERLAGHAPGIDADFGLRTDLQALIELQIDAAVFDPAPEHKGPGLGRQGLLRIDLVEVFESVLAGGKRRILRACERLRLVGAERDAVKANNLAIGRRDRGTQIGIAIDLIAKHTAKCGQLVQRNAGRHRLDLEPEILGGLLERTDRDRSTRRHLARNAVLGLGIVFAHRIPRRKQRALGLGDRAHRRPRQAVRGRDDDVAAAQVGHLGICGFRHQHIHVRIQERLQVGSQRIAGELVHFAGAAKPLLDAVDIAGLDALVELGDLRLAHHIALERRIEQRAARDLDGDVLRCVLEVALVVVHHAAGFNRGLGIIPGSGLDQPQIAVGFNQVDAAERSCGQTAIARDIAVDPGRNQTVAAIELNDAPDDPRGGADAQNAVGRQHPHLMRLPNAQLIELVEAFARFQQLAIQFIGGGNDLANAQRRSALLVVDLFDRDVAGGNHIELAARILDADRDIAVRLDVGHRTREHRRARHLERVRGQRNRLEAVVVVVAG